MRGEIEPIEDEDELLTLASLFVAADHLHRSLSFGNVARTLRDVLTQLVGAQSWACFLLDDTVKPAELRACAGTGVALDEREFVVGKARTPLGRLVERTFEKGELFLADENATGLPRAAFPLRIEGRVIGAIVVVHLLPQKESFNSLDRKLFDLLSVHAASALLSASLHQRASSTSPSPSTFTPPRA